MNKNISYVQVIGTIYNIYNTDGLLIGGYGDERKLVSGPTVSGNTFTIVLEDMYGVREVLTLDSHGTLVHVNNGGKNPNIGENSDKPKVTSIPTTTNNITNEYKKVTKVSANNLEDKNKEAEYRKRSDDLAKQTEKVISQRVRDYDNMIKSLDVDECLFNEKSFKGKQYRDFIKKAYPFTYDVFMSRYEQRQCEKLRSTKAKLINNSKQSFGCLILLYHIINILVMTFFTYTIFTENMNGNDVKGACAVTAAWGFIHSFSKLKWLYIIIILINLIMYLL